MRSRPTLLLSLFTLLLVLVPFLFWRATWFGRRLDDHEIDQCLAAEKLRLVQQGLAQISERIISREISTTAAARWYPRVVALANHRSVELRSTVAWVMGQDNSSEGFHRALVPLLRDPEALVRRNAALSLVRFGDSAGKPEILSMLRPFPVPSPEAGRVSLNLMEEDTVLPNSLLARMTTKENIVVEIRSSIPGRVERVLVADGQTVGRGDQVVLLSPSREQVWEALRALFLVGCKEDLPEVERISSVSSNDSTLGDQIRQQASVTAQAIRSRSLQ